MPTIHLSVKDKRAEGTGAIVCGNSDYRVLWTLDEEWAPYDSKTMRVCQADGTFHDVLFDGTEAVLPVLSAPGWVSIGLYAGDIHTSTPAVCIAVEAITTAGGSPAAPEEDVYAQLMEKLNSMGEVSPEAIAAAVEAYLEEHPLDAADTVKFTAQELSAEEQAQARKNISAASQEAVDAAASGTKSWTLFTMADPNRTGFQVQLNPGSSSPASLRLARIDNASNKESVALYSDGWLTISGRVLKLGYPLTETSNTRIQGLATPVNKFDAATKKYVDDTTGTVISSAAVNTEGHLILTLADGSDLDVGAVVGPTGAAGATPVKGTDYFTDSDKAELVQDVLDALPAWEGGSF